MKKERTNSIILDWLGETIFTDEKVLMRESTGSDNVRFTIFGIDCKLTWKED